MFNIHKKPQGDAAVKKSVQKILDPKKDIVTRLKHLKLVLENVTDPAEEHAIFEQYYSHIYYVFYENFLIAESNVRQKGAHRAQREELDGMLQIFETILTHLPDMIHERWQYNSIDRIIKSLLHPGNSLKLRREGVKLFLLWFRALREHAEESTNLLFASLIPGFPIPKSKDSRFKDAKLESLLNPPIENSGGMCPAEITFLVPTPAGEKTPDDLTRYFLDAVLQFMVVEAFKLQWKDEAMNKLCFTFLWDMFKKYYLGHIFQDFRYDMSLYQPDLSLPEPREPIKYIFSISETGSIDQCITVGAGCPMLSSRVLMIKWIVIFTSNTVKEEIDKLRRLPDKPVHSQASLPLPSSVTQEQEGSNSNTSTLTDKAPSMSSLSSLDDKYKFCATEGEGDMVREVLYSTRENVNIVHEIFRQALMLPLTESKTMRRVIKAYQEWIQDGYTPVFMEVPDISNENNPSQDELGELSDSDEEMRITRRPSGSSLRNISYMRGQLNPMIDEARSTQVRAGSQTTYQLFITNSAHTFLVEPPADAHKLVQAQVDVCKRVLNIYRHMVMHVNMDNVTWTQLLQVLLHITKIMLQDQESPLSIRVTTVAGHLAGPVFQTLIVSWIKANLFVHVSRDLWDELVDVLSSLMHWKELIIEWTKNMDTMTRVLARHVYGIELSDLPLDRLTEQKQMRNRRVIVKEKAPKGAEKSFSKGWGKDANSATSEKFMMKMRSQTAIGGGVDQPDGKIVSANDLDEGDQDKIPVQRKRSNTVLGLESTTDKDASLNNISTLGAEKKGRPPLKRGASDTSDLSSSPPLVNNLLNIAGSKNDSLYRSSSTSDISSEKLASKGLPGTDLDYGQGMRQRCNSGPGVRERVGKGETVHGLPVNMKDNDGVASLSSVEDAFNDMFDELAQQRLSLTLTTSKFEWNMQQEVDSIKSQDSGSIDPSWNPFGEANCASIVEDPVADQYFDARRESEQLEPSDFRDEEEWGSCLEDSNFGDACDDEEHFSSDDSTESSDELDYSSTTDSSEATVQLSSPPYQIYQHGSRDRYDSTALLIPESYSKSKTGTHDSILEEEDTTSDCPDAELEKSSDDILEMRCNNAQLSIIRQASVVGSDGTSEGDDDALALQNKTDSLLTPSEDCSILAGGRRTGWYPEVAVALWRRLLGVLGDVNKIEDPVIHQLVFTYLLKFYDVLFKIRENLGIASDNLSTPAPPVLVPPTRIMSPWAFKAVLSAPDSHKGGCLHAYQLLCKSTLQHHDTRLEPEHLALFYMVLHEGLHSNQDKVNEIVESSSPKIFSCCLPASTLLLLDYIYACHSVAASSDSSSPRVEAQTILGSVLCFPNLYFDVPVLNPDSTDPQAIVCNNIKEYVADALLTSAKKEPSAPARCVALSSLGVWLYEELTSPVDENNLTPAAEGSEGFCYDNNFSPVKGRILARHGRVKEAINVLLVSLKFNNRAVASVACSQLHLLTHCISQLLEYMPDVPLRIIEVMSLTASQLLQNSEAKSSDSGRRLLVSLLLCICDWCMVVPLSMLIETTLPGSDKRLIRTVFKALQTGALGKPGHSAKHSYSLSDLATQDFDPNLQLDKVLENNNHSSSIRNNKLTLPPKSSISLGTDNVVSLTASTVLNHLTNHLGHFPLSKGPSVLNSVIAEQQDHGTDQNQTSDLSNNLFYSPNVQFLIYNDTCLLSIVEIPSQNKTIRGLSTSSTDVRFIVRDTSGKFCWDSSILYGSKNMKEQANQVSIVPLSTLHQDISKVILEHCHLYTSYVKAEWQKKRLVLNTLLPSSDSPLQADHACDKLDQLLQYVGFSSPECQEYPGQPLNIPGHGIEKYKIEERTSLEYLLQQNENQSDNYSSNSAQKSCQSKAAQPPLFSVAQSAFHQSRLLISQTAFLSKENRRRVTLLKKNERLFRELKNLDSRGCRETHKVAVIYIAPGQEDKLSILSNTAGSHDFESFVSGLGWEVDLKTHCGFKGKLNSDGSTGNTCPYYATSTLEVVFHVSTRFPSTNNDSRNIKLKHLGNDEVHIVWSEHGRDYRRGIIPTEFGDVLIIIYPIKHRLYRIQIKKKDEIPYFGPLFDGAIVNARVLPVLVRETAINAGRAKRSQLSLYQPFYEERAKYLRQIIDQFRDDSTFEDYASQLFSPGQSEKTTPASKTTVKKSSPHPTATVPVHVETSVSQISASPLSPSPVMSKTVPIVTPQSALLSNNTNTNNNNNVLSPVLEDVPSTSNYQNEETIPGSPPPIKDPPSPEKEAGPKYTAGHIVSGNKPFHSSSSTTNPLHIFSSKFSGTHLISTPRPKPTGSHSSSMSSLFSNMQHQQQAPLQPTAIPDSTKIHIPVSKMHSSKIAQSASQRRQTSTPIKAAPAPTAGILLSPPPSATKSATNHHTNSSLSSNSHASPLRVQNSGR